VVERGPKKRGIAEVHILPWFDLCLAQLSCSLVVTANLAQKRARYVPGSQPTAPPILRGEWRSEGFLIPGMRNLLYAGTLYVGLTEFT
jgi:hypothetical protein